MDESVAVVQPARTCKATGLTVHSWAERLAQINAVTAVVFLLIGAVAAVLLALTRWEAVHLLPAEWYYRLVTAHGIDMLVVWIVFFECAGLYFGSTILLNSRQVFPGVGMISYFMMLIGALMVNYVVLFGRFDEATVMFTAYPPLKSSPFFYLGIILFAVGALTVCILFFLNLINARREKTFTGPLPLFTYALGAAATIAVFTLVHGAITFIPAFLWSVGIIGELDPGTYRLTFWAFGHSAQQINLCAMVAIWYGLSTMTVGGRPVNQKVSRAAFLLYVMFINMGSAHHLLVDPGFSESWKIFNTSYALYLAVLASLIHALSVPASVEVAVRAKGGVTGLFGWVRKLPWGNPAFVGFALSLLIFGFIGGTTGVIIGTEQVNLRAHNTLRIPGHFHATVVGGTTLAFMAITYYLIPLLFRREWFSQLGAKIQPWLFAVGIVIMSISMSAMGALGIPRRHYDLNLGDAALEGTMASPATSLFGAGIGIGGTIAVISVVIFALNAVATLLIGRKATEAPQYPPLALPDPTKEVAHPEGKKGFAAPGVFALAVFFLVVFVLLYAANWLNLSKMWEIS